MQNLLLATAVPVLLGACLGFSEMLNRVQTSRVEKLSFPKNR